MMVCMLMLSVLLIITGCVEAPKASAEDPTQDSIAQDLGPILYHSWDGFCSMSAQAPAAALCVKSNYTAAQWRPLGEQIVAENSGKVVFLDSRGNLIGRALKGSGICPIWSPDGQYVYAVNYKLGTAIERWDSFGKNRVIVPITGLNTLQLQPTTKSSLTMIQLISFSPSGKRVALLTRDFKEMLIADVNDKSLSARSVLPRGFSYVAQSVWLDDEHLLFVGRQDSTRGELWELDVNSGTTIRRGIEKLWLRDFVTLSPDRQSVIVTASEDGKPTSWNLWQYFLDTSQAKQLTTSLNAEDVEPAWRH
ncbi:MAG: WD40 repeat domain-containing protein [Candidatus Binatus sp.]|uniref:hypothetical protein n=1 Tax=Candidatus Binatus sp. TaxID=2811406 RepID=UPI003CA67DB8